MMNFASPFSSRGVAMARPGQDFTRSMNFAKKISGVPSKKAFEKDHRLAQVILHARAVGQAPTKFDEKTLELKDEITKKLVAQQLAGAGSIYQAFDLTFAQLDHETA
jgi:hypothetical protein